VKVHSSQVQPFSAFQAGGSTVLKPAHASAPESKDVFLSGGLKHQRTLHTLQGADIYFSSQSTRAKLDRFLEDPQARYLMFHFVREQTFPLGQLPKDSSTLVLAKTASPEPLSSAGKSATPRPEVNAPPAEQHVQLHWLHYTPLTEPSLLAQAQTLDFDSSQERLQEKHVAYIPATGDMIAQPVVQRAQQDKGLPAHVGLAGAGLLSGALKHHIVEKSRPWAEKLHQVIRALLPNGTFGPLTFQADGRITFLNRWTFQPSRYWEDTQGHAVKPYTLTRLPNGLLVQVLNKQTLGTYPVAEGLFRKALKERILSEIETVEKQRFVLLADPQAACEPLPVTELEQSSVPPSVPLMMGGAPVWPAPRTENPFAINVSAAYTPFHSTGMVSASPPLET
jgi:hypothetical protein